MCNVWPMWSVNYYHLTCVTNVCSRSHKMWVLRLASGKCGNRVTEGRRYEGVQEGVQRKQMCEKQEVRLDWSQVYWWVQQASWLGKQICKGKLSLNKWMEYYGLGCLARQWHKIWVKVILLLDITKGGKVWGGRLSEERGMTESPRSGKKYGLSGDKEAVH